MSKPIDQERDNQKIAQALRACDWSNVPIGNKAILQAACEALEKPAGVAVLEGFRVMRPTSAALLDGDRWEVYGPNGGGIVSTHDVKDWVVRDLLDALSAAPHPVSGEQKPVTEFDQDISKVALAWMQLIGNFGPTVHADKRELKGYTMDSDGDTVKTYYDSGELRELANSCIEVADWLDRRAQQGEPK